MAIQRCSVITGKSPYLWIDATFVTVREGGRIISVAVMVAVGANTDRRRKKLGKAAGASEAEPFWIKWCLGPGFARG